MKYVVLRADAPLEAEADFSRARSWRDSKNKPSQLTITIEDGDEQDAGSLRADPNNAAVMDASALFSLIPPTVNASANNVALRASGGVKMPAGLFAVGAHTSPFNGQGVAVAVLDTGIDDTHPAFAGKEIAKRDFTGEGTTPEDVTDNNGHGTHCAATICGAVADGVRVGVAPGVNKLCIGKVLGANGGSLEAFLAGMVWAVMDENAAIVSLSLGYDLPGNAARLVKEYGVSPALATNRALQLYSEISDGVAKLRAFLESLEPNVLFIAASGNESLRPKFVLDAGLPAAELLAVGAVAPVARSAADRWEVAPFSNGRVDVVAPGVDVVSAAVGGGWTAMSGTSMATPHAAGVAALWMQKLREAGATAIPDTVRAQLLASATTVPLANVNDRSSVGVGMVQAPQS